MIETPYKDEQVKSITTLLGILVGAAIVLGFIFGIAVGLV